jgi:putative methyltransferase (TIGR04325 family)
LDYETQELINVVIEKNIIFTKQAFSSNALNLDLASLRVSLGLLNISPKMRVLDFGGGGGSSYTIAKVLFPRVNFRWCVVETTGMSKAAKVLENNELKFFGDISEAKIWLGEVDLVYTSGAIQYTENPLRTLKDLVAVNAKNFFITRTVFSEGSSIKFIQESLLSSNGPGPLPEGFVNKIMKYRVVAEPIANIEQVLELGYKIRFKLMEEQGVHIVEAKALNFFGYYCDLK